ncbi:MAG: M14 family zinc carboxypeptidase, partial [Candidatus Thorarchaeota archaeon]
MKFKNHLFLIFTLFLFVPMNDIGSLIPQTQLINFYENKNIDYKWLWDEFAAAPGNINGPDIEIWGSNFGFYHNLTEMQNKLQSLENNFPDLIKLENIGFSYQGNEIIAVRITNELVTQPKKEFLVVAQHHAREIITLENALYFIDRIVFDFINNVEKITEILNERIFYIVPSLNIDALEMLHLWSIQRKNLHPIDEDGDGTRDDNELLVKLDLDNDGIIGEDLPGGVDLNRNYAYKWDSLVGSSNISASNIYRGEAPFSELETQALANFVRKHHFQTAVSLHSGSFRIITPWAHDLNKTCPDAEVYNFIGNTIQSITTLPHDKSYPCSGEWGDWMYGVRGIVAVTLEVYGLDGAETV